MERSQDAGARAQAGLTGGASTHVALLRGVNVGGANRLPMERLRALFVEAGAGHVETLIQSGNVVFDIAKDKAAPLADTVGAAIRREFGFAADIVWRDGAAWLAAISGNPFLSRNVDVGELHLMCLSATPSPASLAKLDPDRSPPDEFLVRGGEIYLRLPHGVARSKLANAWFDKTLGVVSTMRNWRTVTRLAEMVAARKA